MKAACLKCDTPIHPSTAFCNEHGGSPTPKIKTLSWEKRMRNRGKIAAYK